MKSVFTGDLYKKHSFFCPHCNMEHSSPIGMAVIEKGALKKLKEVLDTLELGSNVLVVTDSFIYDMVGKETIEGWEKDGINISTCVFPLPLVPDEKALGTVMVAATPGTDAIVCLGGGSISDICRYVSWRLDIPHIPALTAITHDGFFTDMALLMIGGMKTTITCTPPAAILADMSVIASAPVHMNAAGVGEMASKHTALMDWYAASLIKGERYCPETERLMREAIEEAFSSSEGILRGDEDSVRDLVDALYKSAVDMYWYGNARTGAGGEHHLTHFWVMKHTKRGLKPNLHGAEVGVGCVLILYLWEQMLKIDEDAFDIEKALEQMPDREAWEEGIRLSYEESAPEAFKAQKDKSFDREERKKEIEQILKALPDLRKKHDEFLPAHDVLAAKLDAAGTPSKPSQLHVTREEVEQSVLYAKEVRSKYTSLWVADALGLLPRLSKEIGDFT